MRTSRRIALSVAIAAAAHAAPAAQADAQRSGPGAPDSVGVLLVAHGANEAWNARVDSLAAEVRRTGRVRGPVGVSFLMGPGAAAHRFQDEVATLASQGARHVVVVPLLVSSHSGHYEQIRYLAGKTDSLDANMLHHLHMSHLTRPATTMTLDVTRALDDAPELARVLSARALALAPEPHGRALFILGHGPNSADDYAAWMANLRTVADSVRAATGFASVALELVRDDAPAPVRAEAVKRARELIGLQRAATRQNVVVVPLLVSAGDMSQRKLPADIAGLPVVYSGDPLLPETGLADWVARRVAESLQKPAAPAVQRASTP